MSVCMYKLRPIVSHDETLPPPSHNMYTMKLVQGNEGHPRSATVRLADITDRVQELTQESKGNMASLEGRQEDILKKLAKLKTDIEELRIILRQPNQVTAASVSTSSSATCPPCPELGESRNVVIYASPEHPPYSILGLAHLWSGSCPLAMKSHTHSSVKEAPASAKVFRNDVSGVPHLEVTLVWKEVGPETELVINPVKNIAIRGETNILRFFSRVGPSNFAYENIPDFNCVAQLDEVLDSCQRLARARTVKEKQAIIRNFNASLGKSEWLCGQPKLSIVDVAVWSVLKQLGPSAGLTQTLTKWAERCDSMLL